MTENCTEMAREWLEGKREGAFMDMVSECLRRGGVVHASAECFLAGFPAEEPSIIISRRPCVMIKGTVHKPPLVPDTEKCAGCRACMTVGCPAISIHEKKVRVDPTLCVGCGVCTQLCRFGALEVTGND